MNIVFSILYFLAIFFTNANILLRVIKLNIFNKIRKLIVALFSLIFALEINILSDINLVKELLFYTLILLIFSTLVFLILMSLQYLKNKQIYSIDFAKNIDIWEIVIFVPLFCIFLSKISFELSIVYTFLAFFFFYKVCKNAIKTPKIKQITLSNNKLKNNLKIALIADIHLKRNLNDDFFKKIVDRINEQKPDLVAISGDLIDGSIKDIKCLHYLNDLSSTYGTFYVLGNHEYYHGVASIVEELKKYNINILDNKSIEFNDFVISGVNDLMGNKLNTFKPDINALKPNSLKANILLTHQPKFAKLHDVSSYDLILAGHTHAGQIFPFSLAVKLEQGFLYGYYEKYKMYVTSGAGFWGVVARLIAKSEIVMINLKSKE